MSLAGSRFERLAALLVVAERGQSHPHEHRVNKAVGSGTWRPSCGSKGRFARVEPGFVAEIAPVGLLAGGRRSGRQLAEHSGHGALGRLRYPLFRSRWETDEAATNCTPEPPSTWYGRRRRDHRRHRFCEEGIASADIRCQDSGSDGGFDCFEAG